MKILRDVYREKFRGSLEKKNTERLRCRHQNKMDFLCLESLKHIEAAF